MKFFLGFFLVLVLGGFFLTGGAGLNEKMNLETVPHVDLQRYLGKWYEIARYTNSFQKNCFASTADYSLRLDGDITVVNECRKGSISGKVKQARGKAWVVDKRSNAKLKVRFFWPFSGNYWIIQLGDDYDYAVVGEPERRYLWILYRQPRIPDDLYKSILKRLRSQGYDPSLLLKTLHTQEKGNGRTSGTVTEREKTHG